jgi:hypothetical protein
MTPRGQLDVLDRVAWRCAVRAAPARRSGDPASGGDRPGSKEQPAVEPLSRAAVLKLAFAAACTAFLPLWKASPGHAQGTGACIGQCFESADNRHARNIKACESIFHPDPAGEPYSWRRALDVYFNWELHTVEVAAEGLCMLSAHARLRAWREDCIHDCEKQRRPPEPPPVATLPDPPSAASDFCLGCMNVGGRCCPTPTGFSCHCASVWGPNVKGLAGKPLCPCATGAAA